MENSSESRDSISNTKSQKDSINGAIMKQGSGNQQNEQIKINDKNHMPKSSLENDCLNSNPECSGSSNSVSKNLIIKKVENNEAMEEKVRRLLL